MADPVPPKNLGLKQDFLVDHLVPDPGQPLADVVHLTGFLGKSTQQGHWRLYLNHELTEYVELAEADIVHSQSNASAQNPTGGTQLWVKRTARVQHTRIQSQQVEAEFLQGDITGGMLPGQAGQAQSFAAEYLRIRPTLPVICSRFCSNICSAGGPFAQGLFPIVTCTHPFNSTCCS